MKMQQIEPFSRLLLSLGSTMEVYCVRPYQFMAPSTLIYLVALIEFRTSVPNQCAYIYIVE